MQALFDEDIDEFCKIIVNNIQVLSEDSSISGKLEPLTKRISEYHPQISKEDKCVEH
jgi:hypothetical protein